MTRNHSELAPLIRLAIPVAIAQMANMLMQVVDTYFVGQLGAEALGGVGIGTSIFSPLMVFGVGILFGMDYPVSHAIGARDHKTANHYLIQATWIAALISIPLTALMFWVGSDLSVLGIERSTAAQAKIYLDILAWSLPSNLLFMSFRQYLTSHGAATPTLIIMILANVINAFLNWVLVFGRLGTDPMGISGSAWATFYSRLFMMVAVIAYTYWFSSKNGLNLSATPLGFETDKIKKILRLGIPASLQLLLEVGVFAGATLIAGRLGAVPVAAHQIVLQIASFTFMIPLGFSSAASVRVAQALGRGEPENAHAAGSLAIGFGAAIMTVCGLTIFLFGNTILDFFTTDLAVVEVGQKLLLIAALFQISDGIQVVSTGALRGTGDTRKSMVANLFGHWFLGLPLGLVLCFTFDWGITGIWAGLSTGLTVVAVALLVLWRKRTK
jgi:MATE family multidrug resistance protein